MGLWGRLFGKHKQTSVASDIADNDIGFGDEFIQIPSRDFFGESSRSPNGRFTIAWTDGGPNQSRRGRYIFLDRGKVVFEGSMPRPNDGKVADNGVFILNDWGAVEALSGTLAAFRPDGKPIIARKLKANLFNNGLSADGRWAICQTANAPSEDGGRLFVFDLAAGIQISSWQAASGWADQYVFSADGQIIFLEYRDRGSFAYGIDGTFLDRTKWLAAGLQRGDLAIIEELLCETKNLPSRELTDLLLPAINLALAAKQNADAKSQARAHRLSGTCLEAMGNISKALTAYERALSLDEKVGVKRKVDQLRKSFRK
ncbi:tetratricopeptide repeat protein [Afipia birgiae]|jgi:hypothetical protein|uniref:tetratricopeptide repeat protein n=1 Tax=Afipia birgiae TaxID=151414 RepID=UPI000369044F|nr:tetratricopeptide repeat protein [Afipia birgiae]MBX9822113.1 tetratricopeptide repeat protein [Afipia birgiae]